MTCQFINFAVDIGNFRRNRNFFYLFNESLPGEFQNY